MEEKPKQKIPPVSTRGKGGSHKTTEAQRATLLLTPLPSLDPGGTPRQPRRTNEPSKILRKGTRKSDRVGQHTKTSKARRRGRCTLRATRRHPSLSGNNLPNETKNKQRKRGNEVLYPTKNLIVFGGRGRSAKKDKGGGLKAQEGEAKLSLANE